LVASLQILNILIDQQKPISQIAKIFEPYPQILENIRYNQHLKNPLENKMILDFIENKKIELDKKGRILVRKSGTENLIRIMVEGKDFKQIKKIVDEISHEIKKYQD